LNRARSAATGAPKEPDRGPRFATVASPMFPRAGAAVLACLPGLALACSGAAPEPEAPPPPPPAAAAPVPLLTPVRWLVPSAVVVEHTGEGLDRAVVSGRRMELSGMEIVRAVPGELDGGALAPAWAPAGTPRYLFWRGRRLHGADTWGGELRPIATLPAEVRGAFDWLDGEGLFLASGALVVRAGATVPIGIPGVVRALAGDARRGVALTALGHALITVDGGASYRDVTAEIGGATAFEVRGDAIAVTLPGGHERSITSSGAIIDRAAPPAPRAGSGPPAEPDRLEGGSPVRAIDAAVERGLPLPDGGVIVADRGMVGRFDLATLRTSGAAPLDPGLERAVCVAFRAADAPLLACADGERAAVIDLTGAPRTERTFAVAADPDADRFTGADGEALGFLGPCEGGPAPRSGPALYTWGAPRNPSRQRSAAFCVRAGRDAWVEHRLDPADEPDVIAWIPRAGGGAVAVVARHASFLAERERVSVEGALRVVRIARSEPPLQIPDYVSTSRAVLDRSLRAGADDVIQGWLPHGGNGPSLLSVTIDAGGHVRAHDAPRAHAIVAAGRLALAAGEEGQLFETVDGGLRWSAVEGPPGAPAMSPPSTCSPAGCRVGPFVRLGWSTPEHALPAGEEHAEARRSRAQAPVTPLLRLTCAFAGAPEGRRMPESAAFGFTPSPQPRSGSLVRIGALGFATVPWNGPQVAASGDAELAWVSPLDLAAKVSRRTVSLARFGAVTSQRLYDLRTGYLLGEGGRVEAFATGYREQCPRELLEEAGVVRALGGCAEDPAVGVDLGGRVIVLHWGYDGFSVLAADTPASARRDARGARGSTIAAGLHELSRVSDGWTARGMTVGAGVRAGAPVAVVLDATGEASLAPIDPDRGTFGPEERLRPLAEALLGGAPACAPRPDDARIVLPFEGVIGLDRTSIRGVTGAGGAGVAVLRWSASRACLDAVETAVRDERYEDNPGPYPPHGTLEKLIARFGGPGAGATLLLVGTGWELRQKVSCTGLSPGRESAP
jgi:hypothetical protein